MSLRTALAFLEAGDGSVVGLARFLVDVGGVGGAAGDAGTAKASLWRTLDATLEDDAALETVRSSP